MVFKRCHVEKDSYEFDVRDSSSRPIWMLDVTNTVFSPGWQYVKCEKYAWHQSAVQLSHAVHINQWVRRAWGPSCKAAGGKSEAQGRDGQRRWLSMVAWGCGKLPSFDVEPRRLPAGRPTANVQLIRNNAPEQRSAAASIRRTPGRCHGVTGHGMVTIHTVRWPLKIFISSCNGIK